MISWRAELTRLTTTLGKLIIGILIFAGVPLIGWGLRHLESYFQNPARTAYIFLAIILQIVVVIWLPEVGSHRGRESSSSLRNQLMTISLQIFPLGILFLAPFSDRRSLGTIPDGQFLRYLGLLIYVLGFGGMHWAEAALGRQFSVEVTIQEDHKLITTGIYRFIRHPRYLCIILFSLGISFIFRSWLTLILVGVLTFLLLLRIQDEEALLLGEFEEQWTEYKQRSWRLLPYIY